MVTLEQVLQAREERVEKQNSFIKMYKRPVISFCMNIPGPEKTSMLIKRAFHHGIDDINRTLSLPRTTAMYYKETGPEALIPVEMDAQDLKALCVEIENSSPLGRLFDMDVIDTDGNKLERKQERSCIVCGKTGRGCASRRVHTLEELQKATQDILVNGLKLADRQTVIDLATDALKEEVFTTPKPGLVDRNNNGSHKDMDLDSFLRSIEALKPYWGICFDAGLNREPFQTIREAGIQAEKDMYMAAGANTHKGAIFLLGTLCCATGRLWDAERGFADAEDLAQEAAAFSTPIIEADFKKIEAKAKPETTGERLYLEHNIRGIRGELADGLPSVINTALPAYEMKGAVDALLRLIALGKDTNMISRGGLEEAKKAADKTREILETNYKEKDVLDLDAYFIEHNLSPGGCADLLAVTAFFSKLSRV